MAAAHFNLGLLLRESGRDREGDAEIAIALRLDPDLARRLPSDASR
jgi:hypothetical protein